MALATYSDLQATVASVLDRTDLTAIIPDWVTLAEANLARDVRHWRGISRATTAFDTPYTALPTDWLATIRVHLSNAGQGYRALALMGTDEMERRRAQVADTAGVPAFYAHLGDEIEVWPTPTGSYTGELTYYAKPAALASASVNWLLTHAPDAYLYGTLLHSAPYLRDDPRLAVWAGLYGEAVGKLNAESAAAEHSGTALRLRPANR